MTITFWGESNDKCSLSHFNIVLRKKVYKDVKDFYSNNDILCIIIHSFFIVLCIHISSCLDFNLF